MFFYNKKIYNIGKSTINSYIFGNIGGIMENIGSKISKLLENKGLTQRDLAKIVGVTEVTISRYINGIREPKGSILNDIAIALNVSSDYLLGRNVSSSKPVGIKIPVLGRVQAGVPIEAVTDIIDEEEITEELNRTGDFFALQVNGNSMEPRMLEGDVVIVRKQPYIESGEVAIVLVNGCDATIKKVIKQDNGLLLVAEQCGGLSAYVLQHTGY